MLPSFLSNMFWSKRQETWRDAAVEHTASEEVDDDWLLITTQQTPIDGDCDSVTSDGSWVLTPSPAFHSSSLAPSSESSHPLEDLLIEHPTMSVYCRHKSGSKDNLNEQTDAAVSDTTTVNRKPQVDNLNNQQHDEEIRLRNQQHREMVLRQNRRRQQLAAHMQIPLGVSQRAPPNSGYGAIKPPQMSKKALKRQNVNNARQRGGKLHQGNRVQKSTFKAGRRRC